MYAPTLGSFHPEILEVPPHLHLVVKLHPLYAEQRPALIYQLQQQQQIELLKQYPPIYPLLDVVDLYLGDISSVGYDFLAFNKPLVFIEGGRPLYSHRFGRVASPRALWPTVEEALAKGDLHLEQARQEAYDYTFAPSPSREELYTAIREYYEN